MTLLKRLALMTTGGLVLLALLVSVGLLRSGSRFFAGLNLMFNGPEDEPKVDVRSLVVRKIRGASELTTAVFTMEAVVPSSRDRFVGNFTIGKTTLLYIAFGEVRAGVDLQDLEPEDIRQEGETLIVELPVPRILDSKIDVNRSSAYDYDRGFLGLGPDVAPQLQDLSQETALEKIVAAACSEGILEEANKRAELTVSQLLASGGVEKFEIEIQSPKQGDCVPSAVAAARTSDAP